MPSGTASRGSFARLLAPLVAGGLLLAVLIGALAGVAYAVVLVVVLAIVVGAIVAVRHRGASHGHDGSRSSDASTPHQGFDASPLGDTDQLSSMETTGSVARDREELDTHERRVADSWADDRRR